MSGPRKNPDCATCEKRSENIFCTLPPEGVEILNKAKITNQFKRGQYVFYAGNSPNGVFCVQDGVVKVEAAGSNGNAHILRVVKGGGILGYRSLFAEEPYAASALVQEDATICWIGKEAILELFQKYPALGIKLLGQLSHELHGAEERMCSMSDKNAAERVAEALLFLKDHHPDQNWTRREIAEWAGTTTETVIRTLAQFEDEGLIEQKGRKILVQNKSELFERANLTL